MRSLTMLACATIRGVDLTGLEPVTPGWKARWRRTCEALREGGIRTAVPPFLISSSVPVAAKDFVLEN